MWAWLGNLLKGLRPALLGRLGDWVMVLIMVAVVGAVIFGRPVYEWGMTKISGPPLSGVLSIEPPQLYTRERLVNDRFSQANWLEQLLAETNKPEVLREIGRPTSQSRTETEDSLKLIAALAGGGPAAGPGAPKDQSKRGETVTSSAQVSTSGDSPAASLAQRIRELDKLRLRLRTDLMDTLLDDGHDLEGNTLYRLNFDAVVMPFKEQTTYPGTGVFIVEMANSFQELDTYLETAGQCLDVIDQDATMIEDCEAIRVFLEKRSADDVELLRSWQREIQQFLTSVLQTRSKAFNFEGRLVNPVDPKENIAFDWFLRRELLNAFFTAISFHPRIKLTCAEFGLEESDCLNRIAESIGLKWRVENRVPDFADEQTGGGALGSGYRKSLRRAHYVNAVRYSVQRNLAFAGPPGQGPPPEAQEPQGQLDVRQTSEPPKPGGEEFALASNSLPNDVTTGESNTTGKLPKTRKPDVAQRPRNGPPPSVGPPPTLLDPEYKRALIRLILVWREMAVFMQSMTELPASEKAAFGSETEAIAGFERKLFETLMNFDRYLPGPENIGELQSVLKRDFDVRQQHLAATAHLLPPMEDGIEHCRKSAVKNQQASMQADAIISEYYRCAFLFVEGGRATHDLLARFIYERLRDGIPGYVSTERSITDFLEVTLDGCAVTGCQIAVSQKRCKLKNDILEYTGEESFLDTVWRQIDLPFSNVFWAVQEEFGNDPSDCDEIFQSVSEDPAADAVVQKCLTLVALLDDEITDMSEAYIACHLRQWIDTRKSDVAVYTVSPRAGEGEDLELNSASLKDDLSGFLKLPAGKGEITAQHKQLQDVAAVLSNPSVIGFSDLPTIKGIDNAIFGWAVRPNKMPAGGYMSSRHRFAAVISVPSWWKRVTLNIKACWIQPNEIRRSGTRFLNDFTKLCPVAEPKTIAARLQSHGRVVSEIDQDTLASENPVTHWSFELKLPRRMDEITSRFNFDFIKAPYFYPEFDETAQKNPYVLALEAGRPGKLVLSGERLWRGTVVTVGNQPADRIEVLPDMKGVIAHFNCVKPPEGSRHFEPMKTGASGPAFGPGGLVNSPLFVWTSEGSTNMRFVKVAPFVQRMEAERPCWLPANSDGN
ncbi:MAG: hypothetical protein K5905_02290 [Roseibium sp.]|uniref:hypothetical protein n=1 Tax=Roseibium sp. TaxID=1936156 RepID=UPI0026113B28|nr:hypothetical protein [Roseibium sp.]MCV0424278.1 hypothetical protein [Roseibium sp.]